MTAPVQPGTILAGKYKIERVLGMGGMGVVVAALHLDLDERVAIKFLLPDVLEMPEVVERFSREGKRAVKIKSEHVARVIDVDRLDDGAPYMVMEYLEGEDLSNLLMKRGSLPVPEAVEYVLQACEAIAEAHALGIVHRDLKPANLFLTTRTDGTPSIKVLDFGICKGPVEGTGPEAALTKTSTVVGSPQYMSPEQMRSIKNVDARGDIWGLGVILHELVAGRAAFSGETMPELVLKIMADEVAPLSRERPGTPRGLDAVVQRCLQKTPDKRYQSIVDLAAALIEFAPKRAAISLERIRGVLEQSAKIRRTSAAPESERVAPAATLASWGTSAPVARGGGRLQMAGIAVVVLVVGAATLFGLRGRFAGAASGKDGPVASAAPAASVMPLPLPKTAEPPTTVAAPSPPPVVVPAPPVATTAAPTTSASPVGRPIQPPAPRVSAAPAPAPATAAPVAPPEPPPPPTANFDTQK